jgi:uncharacterized protein (DUF924 family)
LQTAQSHRCLQKIRRWVGLSREFLIDRVADVGPNPYFQAWNPIPKPYSPDFGWIGSGFCVYGHWPTSLFLRATEPGADMNDSLPSFSAQVALDFWFGAPDSPEFGQSRKAWFAKDDAFDAEIHRQFAGLHHAAAHGMLDHFWKDLALPNLALTIVLDQFSRQLFRNDAKAFAQDGHALTVAKYAIAEGYDRDALPTQRVFWYRRSSIARTWRTRTAASN